MTEQLNIFDLLKDTTGEKLAETGLQMAVDSAENAAPGWKERCWQLFLEWLSQQKHRSTFRTETFRVWCELGERIEKPPSSRAYGFIPKRAVKEELISWAGYDKAVNKKAHATPCSLWMVIG
jgi:hypothetical protein